MQIQSKLPRVGTTVFTVMSQLAAQHQAVNLGQGFPDFTTPQRLRDALAEAMQAGHNPYAPMSGVLALREQIARKVQAMYGPTVDPESEVTVREALTPRTRMLIVNTPHNPSGAVFDAGDLAALADLTRDTNICILSERRAT
jgi:methionine aminotransferase